MSEKIPKRSNLNVVTAEISWKGAQYMYFLKFQNADLFSWTHVGSYTCSWNKWWLSARCSAQREQLHKCSSTLCAPTTATHRPSALTPGTLEHKVQPKLTFHGIIEGNSYFWECSGRKIQPAWVSCFCAFEFKSRVCLLRKQSRVD